ncbi:hypothetical protein FRC01_005889 [Tulasnella sp. 417]|nr:hypothetical protein FRC01_005889 [Tulasnella sp. 417]
MASDSERLATQLKTMSVADPPEVSKITEEERIKLRAVKREAIQMERKKKAEELKEKGNQHFELQDYDEALTCYVGASLLDGNNAVYYCKEAAVNLKLEMYNEAEMNADFALDLEPRNIEARYRRAMARMALGKLKSARADFFEMLKLDPDSADAKLHLLEIERKQPSLSSDPDHRSMRAVELLLGWGSEYEGYDENGDYFDDDYDGDSDEGYSTSILAAPGVDSDAESVDSFHSHTSDYEHEGNGIPCHAYNHQGCEKRKACEFSHAPDRQSLRDDLGKNVCLRFVAKECPFKDECVYSHVDQYLPLRKRSGPWTKEDAATELRLNKTDSDFDEAVYDNFQKALDTWKTTGLGRPLRD